MSDYIEELLTREARSLIGEYIDVYQVPADIEKIIYSLKRQIVQHEAELEEAKKNEEQKRNVLIDLISNSSIKIDGSFKLEDLFKALDVECPEPPYNNDQIKKNRALSYLYRHLGGLI